MNVSTREVRRELYRVYWGKAREFFDAMKTAEEAEDWNAAALNAIHCAISSVDALNVRYQGKRSAGQRHEDAVYLLKQSGLSGVDEKVKQFQDVLRLKTLVEYEPDEPSENETKQILRQASRLYEWVRNHLEK